jgi:UDP-N-acetylglucosamine--N-acetylmuramyl-(pentapeptide) pyrophosphoryl-undecaprenol N-acetylglucosamine transferase
MPRLRDARILLLANDGLSAGHVVRATAIARALVQQGARPLLATSSDAVALAETMGIPSVRLPSRAATELSGWPEAERTAVLSGILGGVVDGFSPDALVADTFPAGPHFEYMPILRRVRCRVLVRRAIRAERESSPEARACLELYGRVIAADDPGAIAHQPGPVEAVRVGPITLLGRSELLSRKEARKELGLLTGRHALLAFGGGADHAALDRLRRTAAWVREAGFTPVVALGPLFTAPADAGCLCIRALPLQRYLAAFDLAIASAGYNTSHELARSGVRAVLFGNPRAFDDQTDRARRFERAGLAIALARFTARGLAEAIRRAEALDRPALAGNGAATAARVILEELGA